MNRNQRRTLGRAMRRAGKVVITLRGGPMDGWLVKQDAPCLQPEWRAKYLEAAAEQLYRAGPRGFLKPKWDRLSPEAKAVFLAQAAEVQGAGYYVTDSTGTEAKWVTQ